MGGATLEVTGVAKRFGSVVTARDVSFEVRSGLAGPPFLLTDSCAPNEIRSSRPLDAACSSAIGLT